MLYAFTVVTARPPDELSPEPLYFRSIIANTQRAVAADVPGQEEAMAVSEYLDCVDSGAIQMDKALYRQSLSVLGEFLHGTTEDMAEQLAAKSWAAKTILDVLVEVTRPNGLLAPLALTA